MITSHRLPKLHSFLKRAGLFVKCFQGEVRSETQMETYEWPLGDGSTLEFTVHEFTPDWNQVAGLHIFAYIDGGRWIPLYVGQTADSSARISSHELWDRARHNGATHVHALAVQRAANRDKWEKMLIQHLCPPLNQKSRPYPMVPPIFLPWNSSR
jgi:hypothetical protein